MKIKPITVKDLIHHLKSFKNPNAELVYSCDDEGNYYQPVFHTASIGKYIDGEFYMKDGIDKDEYDKLGGKEVVCIN